MRKERKLNKLLQPALLFALLFFILAQPVFGHELHLALADSTCNTVKEVGKSFTKKTGIDLKYTCKSSGQLAKGIQAGIINADFFLSANKKWMDNLVKTKFIDAKNVKTLWANELVVASNASSTLTLHTLADLTSSEVKTIIIGTPDKAPFGRYTKQALQNAQLWMAVRPKITSRKNISLAVTTLEEEADGVVGFLYRTGLKKSLRHHVTVPESLHDPIRYFSGPISANLTAEGLNEFLSFLTGEQSREIFKTAGFIVLP